MTAYGHNTETCNCDACRYWRYGMTVKVASVSSPRPFRENAEDFIKRSKDDYQENLRIFLEQEARGEAIAPSGPFTKENGWDIDPEHGIVCWGGGVIPGVQSV